MEHPSYIHDFAVVLGVAALTSTLFRKLKQPSILGYLLAGFIVGPYLPIPLVAEPERVSALSEFGVVLVMFVIGLEFQIAKLWKVLPSSGLSALIQMGVLLLVGYQLGLALGWQTIEALFLGASIAISSTMIVTKIFEDQVPQADIRTMVLGILVVQDVAAIVLITAMSALVESGSVTTLGMLTTLGRLGLTLVGMIALGLLVVPRLVRAVNALDNKETLVVTAIGLCFGFALLAEMLEYSVALGAFVAGLLVSESGRGHDIEVLITPVKDIFVAVFFVSVGMSVDPLLALGQLDVGVLVFVAVVLTQLFSVAFGGILLGQGFRQSITAGLALGQIGEFAFIISAIGASAGVLNPGVQPVIISVAVLTAFSTPLALKNAPAVIGFLDRFLPVRLKHILVFYESWLDRSRKQNARKGVSRTPTLRAVRALALDTLIWLALLSAVLFWQVELVEELQRRFELARDTAGWIIRAGLVLISIPPVWGIVRNTNAFVFHYMDRLVNGSARRGVIMTETSQRFLRLVIKLSVVLGVGVPLAVVLHMILGTNAVALSLIVVLLIMLFVVWRSAGQLDLEIISEAKRLVDFLDSQRSVGVTSHATPADFMPDISSMDALEITADSPWVGCDLRALDLRAATGALILAIHRDGRDVAIPTGSERLCANDLLMITGSASAMAAARARILNGATTTTPR